MKKDDSRKIRIVDLQGKSHGVKTRVPALNASILRSQGKMPADGNLFSASPAKQNLAVQNSAQNTSQKGGNFGFNGAVNSGGGEALKNKYAQNNATDAGLQNAKNTADYNTPPTRVLNEDQNSKVKAGDVGGQKVQEVEYDLSDNKGIRQSPKKTAVIAKYKKSKPKVKSSSKKPLQGVYVQTGAFSGLSNAKRSARIMKKYARVQIEESTVSGKKIYRVLLGSFADKNKAGKVIKQIKKDGRDAIIVKKR